MATIIDFKTRKAIVPTEIVREELDEDSFLDDLGEPETELKETDEYQREQTAHRLIIPPYPNLCVQCGEPMSTDGTAHLECIKAYEDYWDEREKELERRASSAANMGDLDDIPGVPHEETEQLGLLWLQICRENVPVQHYDAKALAEIVNIAPALRPFALEICGEIRREGSYTLRLPDVHYIVQEDHPF